MKPAFIYPTYEDIIPSDSPDIYAWSYDGYCKKGGPSCSNCFLGSTWNCRESICKILSTVTPPTPGSCIFISPETYPELFI